LFQKENVYNNKIQMNHYLLSTVLVFCAGLSVSAQTLPFKNPSLSAHERAVDLCSRLTLEEKAQLMLDESPAIPRLGIKKFFWWSEALHGLPIWVMSLSSQSR
jgi:beta-glucosidase